MNDRRPHIVQYQGSKRLLASQILCFFPNRIDRLLEPFSGMAAISIAAMYEGRARRCHLNDINKPLINLLKEAIDHPERLLRDYTAVWAEQFDFPEGHLNHFYAIRDDFNDGNTSAANMLYLLARCVKGAVRYGRNGNFNQSPDKRRHGASPTNLRKNLLAISAILRGRTTFSCDDFKTAYRMASPGDLVYMDPPYQGVSNVRDGRYFSGVSFEEFSESLDYLNCRGIDFLISYDGVCGGKKYGAELPKELGCEKILLNAGLSSQATLLGESKTTFEALYISRNLRSLVLRYDYAKRITECPPIQTLF